MASFQTVQLGIADMADLKDIEMQIAEVDGDEKRIEQLQADNYTQSFKVYEDARIPVSRQTGAMWSARLQEIDKIRKSSKDIDRWDEAIKYYQNDQLTKERGQRLDTLASANEGKSGQSTENIVFANTSALVPATYAKNPDVSLTTDVEENAAQVRMFEKLLNKLLKGKIAPCVNLKPKMKKLVVLTNLTNIGYLYLSYVDKENASDGVMRDIEDISEKLTKAKTVKEIEELEGQLMALDEKINLLDESGFKIRTMPPHNVYVDPNAEQADLSDARFVIVTEMLSTSYIEAVYGEKDENGVVKSIYKPTHVLPASKSGRKQDEHENEKDFELFTNTSEHSQFGYSDDQIEEFKQNRRTKVATVWDKLTRRVLMYNTSDWSWPIWVWDDPFGLSRFFPIFPLTFVTDPLKTIGSSEVTYYLDQQDEINKINNERARMREWAASKVFVNTNVIDQPEKVANFLMGDTDQLVYGIDLPTDGHISQAIGVFAAPSTQFDQLFDTTALLESINRISSVSPVLRNVEFKTNTTNKAIDTYQSSSQMRLDEKIDALEDLIGDVAYAILEIAVQKLDELTVAQLVGKQVVQEAGGWTNMEPEELNNMFVLECVGGSTLKPTSAVKKEQAMNLTQILGQFAGASPHIVLVMLKIIERAFKDDYVVQDQDWAAILQVISQQLQIDQQQQQMQQQQPPQEQMPQQQGGQPQENGAQSIEEVAMHIAEIVDNLPPEAKQFLAEGVMQGMPFIEIVQTLMQQMQQMQQQQPQQ